MAAQEASIAEVKAGIYTKFCTLCNREMSQSKILPCFHTLCLVCLEDASKMLSKGYGDKMPCPVCENEFTIPLEGFTALETNVFIKKLLVVHQSIDSSHKGCDACYKDSDTDESAVTGNRIAEEYCMECQHKLCKKCLEHHKKFKTTKEHRVVGINGNRSSNCDPSDVPSLCERHMLQLKMYCTECDKVICETCFQERHQNHRMQDVKTSSDNSKIEIQKITEGLSDIESEVLIYNERLEKEKIKLLAHLETVRAEIVTSGDRLKELIDEKVQSLLHEVDSYEKKKEVETEKHKKISHRFAANLTYFGSCCSEILNKASADEICWAMSKLRLRADELRQQQLNIIRSRSYPLNISFERTELDCFANGKLCHVIGHIKVNNSIAQSKRNFPEHGVVNDQHRVCNEIQKIREIKTIAADKEAKQIIGMAILNQELFLASSRNSTVEVYDTLTLSFRRRWSAKTSMGKTTNDVDDIRSMGSCNRNNSLYILHYKSTKTCEILRTDGNGRTIAQWTTKHGEYGYSLSVTEEGNVVVVNYWANKLKEYGPDGQFIRKCNLSKFPGITHPSHAIKLTNGHFVVCHGLNSDQLHRVCVVDPHGCLPRSFGGCKGSGVDQLNDPFHLALGADGSVFVADWQNGRVLELSSDFGCAREVLSKENGLRFPRCICLDMHTGRLFVADDQLKTCLVFDIRHILIRTNRQML